ncbi:hypothetical protein WA026_013083 [Henosepilachna vigintioctopunctata]|uniref:P-type domain-containing protein n=1 Tax=Henosepilachna vigintioctopunctata TaxID=420089 RepID=A0AAW1UIX3_9CUCU
MWFQAYIIFIIVCTNVIKANTIPNVRDGDSCSSIDDKDKEDCYPQSGSSKQGCLDKGCCWKEAHNPSLNVPWCFYPPGNDHPTSKPNPPHGECPAIEDFDKVDCYPEMGASEGNCLARGCCWEEANNPSFNTPWCFFNQTPGGASYTFKDIKETETGMEASLELGQASAYPRDVKLVKMIATYQEDNILNVKFIDPENERYESLYPKHKMDPPSATNPAYKISISEDNSGFKIIRKSDNTPIFDATDMSQFIYSDQFLQISTKLTSTNIYGLGEHKKRFKLSTDGYFTMWARDISPSFNTNLYGSHPFYMLMEDTANAHGVFLRNSNGMDVFLRPKPSLTYRVIGGILDFYFFLGPTPADVIKQYQNVIGKPKMPPYWGLGFHLCHYGIKTLDATKAVLKRNLDAGVPIEVQWNDLDYMKDQNGFTYDTNNFKGLPEFVDDLHKQGRKYVIIIDPGVSGSEPAGSYLPFDKGQELDIFVKDYKGENFIAKVWNPTSTVFPDFTNPKSLDYWKALMEDFRKNIRFDGAWIDMNEPANFLDGSTTGCPESELENPKYVPRVNGGSLRARTVCMTAKQHGGLHYNLHNLYGISESEVTSNALASVINQRAFVISRSTFPGTGQYAGHWSGDINSNWEDLRYSIPELLDFSLFGVPLMGADICGFNGASNEQLCNRWMQLGAFYPFSRNHNTNNQNDQDPAAFGELVIKSSKKALGVRYTLLPYLYTLFWHANQEGTTVARPLVVEFPEDKNTYDIDTSFLWGSGLLIAPVLDENPTSMSTYLPKGVWYDYYTRSKQVSQGAEIKIQTAIDTIPLFLHGGVIIPTQTPASTTEEVRKSKFNLVAALDENGSAKGTFYWDDGVSLDVGEDYTLFSFEAVNGKVTVSTTHKGKTAPPNLGNIEVLGANKVISGLTVLGSNRNHTYTYNEETQNLLIENLDISEFPITVHWS